MYEILYKKEKYHTLPETAPDVFDEQFSALGRQVQKPDDLLNLTRFLARYCATVRRST
jgi:hypothetical protein